MRYEKTEWVRVTRAEPCPICKRTRYCTRSVAGDAVHCTKAQSDIATERGWIHKLGGDIPELPFREATKEERPSIDWSERARNCFERGIERLHELAEQLHVSEHALRQLGVGRGWDSWAGRAFWSFPERSPEGKTTGIVRRFEDGKKLYMKWSRPGIYFEKNWRQHFGPIFLPEGGSGTAALITLGVSAIGRPSNISEIKPLIAMLRRDRRRVIVLGDNDEHPEKRGEQSHCPSNCGGCNHCFPGWYGAKATADRLNRVFRGRVSWLMVPGGVKDSRDWLIEHGEPGGAKKFLEAIREAEEKRNAEPGLVAPRSTERSHAG